MKWEKIRSRLFQEKSVLWFYAFAAVVVSLHRWALSPKSDGYTNYENYVIFRNAYAHLLSGQNIYAAFPAEQWDLFKYSPAFALFMAPFSLLPDWLGLCCWNLLNAWPLALAILALPLAGNKKYWIAWWIALELITSMQSSQSNGLMAALMLWCWIAVDRKQAWLFGFCTAAAFFIKIFGIFCLLPALLYPNRIKNYAWTLFFCLFFAVFPVFFVGFAHLGQTYQWWLALLQTDHSASLGLSVQGLIFSWFGLSVSKTGTTLLGLGLLALATLSPHVKRHILSSRPLETPISETHQSLAWAGLLLWVVIFNHKAESPTFVIAMLGAVLCYGAGQRRKWELWLLVATFILVSLSPTDIFPRSLREQYIQPHVLKALPCVIFWFIAIIRLFQNKKIHV